MITGRSFSLLISILIVSVSWKGVPASIGSFAGASSLNDLVPLVYYAVIVLIGVGMMALGGYGIARNR